MIKIENKLSYPVLFAQTKVVNFSKTHIRLLVTLRVL